MKKLVYLIVALVAFCMASQSCSDNVTYADMLKEENGYIDNFIKDSNIVVLSQSEFLAQDSVTDVSRNEYVQLTSGVYMQIVEKGSDNPADTIRSNDQVLVRFIEYSVTDTLKATCSNITYPDVVDRFRYTATSTQITGVFISGAMYAKYQSTAVPSGWLTIFPYIRDGAHVKLLVPSKMGHESAMEYVRPYFYDLRRITFYK